MILVIGALFRRERPLIHRIGNIKKFHHQLEIRHVVAHIAQGPDAIGKPARERGDRTDILRNIADAEGAAQRFEANKKVYDAVQDAGDRLGSRFVKPQRAPCVAGHPAFFREKCGEDRFQLLMEKVLLLIDSDILCTLRLICCNIVKEGKKAVAELYILAGLCPVCCAFVE